MDIQCPSCQKKLNIDDQFAGQLTKCPACAGVFMAPTLVTPPAPPPPPAPKQDVIPFTSEPPPAPRVEAPKPPPPPVTFEPVGPPGEFTKSHTCRLCPDALRWVMPGALTLLFVVSFLTWIVRVDATATATVIEKTDPPQAKAHLSVAYPDLSLWSISFGDHGNWLWIFYVLLVIFLALPLAWARILLETDVIPKPDFLKPYWDWRFALLGGVLGLTFLLALLARMQLMPDQFSAWGMFLGLRIHLVALIACGLEHWLDHRKKSRLPLPEMTTRW